MRRTHLIGTALAVSAFAGCETIESAPALRVGALNIEWLGVPDKRFEDAAGIAQRPGDIAEYIRFSGVAVLGLAEINANVRNGDDWRNDTLEKTFALLSRQTKGRWTHRLFPDRRDGIQVTGLAWDEMKVRPVDPPFPIPVTSQPGPLDRNLWSRPPWAQKFTTGDGRTDFVVIMLHQKSNYGGDYTVHRGAESEELVAMLPVVRKQLRDEDVLIVGDTNCVSHAEPGVQAIVAAGFIDLNAADEPTHVAVSRGGLDRIYVPREQPEFARSRLWVVRDDYLTSRRWPEPVFRRRVSDHYLVVTTIEVGPDDD